MDETQKNEKTVKEKTIKEKEKNLVNLFLVFLKIGLFTFGGGYAMIPLIQREITEKKKWISDKDILDIVSIAESTPGPIAINSATFVGYKIAGVPGAFLATLGVVLPSFVIILAVSFVLAKFQTFKTVQYAFNGIRAGVLALIIKALASMYKQCPKSAISYIIAAAAFVAVAFLSCNVLIVIASCAVVGLAYSLIMTRIKKNDLS